MELNVKYCIMSTMDPITLNPLYSSIIYPSLTQTVDSKSINSFKNANPICKYDI